MPERNGHKPGAVLLKPPPVLGRELRLRITPQHMTSLQALAKVHKWSSPTALAEALLADRIEEAARSTAEAKIVTVMTRLLA